MGRTREQWGEEHSSALTYFDSGRLHETLAVSLSRVTATLKAAEAKLRAHRRALVRVANVEEPLGIIAQSPKMKQVTDLARRVAKVDATVLITGESGVGKERMARLVHEESTREARPFIAVNCGSRVELDDLPEEIRQALPTPVARSGGVRPLKDVEKEYILAALDLNRGNQTHTARQLGIGSATLYRKLKSYGSIGAKEGSG